MKLGQKLTNVLLDFIQANLPDKRFTMYDIKIVGKTNKFVAGALQRLERHGLLLTDGTIINECGKDSPVYKLSTNAAILTKARSGSTTEYRRKNADQEAFLNECGAHLHMIMDNIERRNAHHA